MSKSQSIFKIIAHPRSWHKDSQSWNIKVFTEMKTNFGLHFHITVTFRVFKPNLQTWQQLCDNEFTKSFWIKICFNGYDSYDSTLDESRETENIYMQYLKLLITYDHTSRFPKLQKHSKLVAPELAFLSNLWNCT